MDVEQGHFVLAERLPNGSVQVNRGAKHKQFLDPELAGEGEKVDKIILSDGEKVSWTPPRVKPSIPDWSEFPSIKHYFNRTGYQTWPCWFYHPTEQPIIVKDAEEAFTRFGIKRRKATDRERALQGAGEWVWDTPQDCQWQPAPYAGNVPGTFDPLRGEQGKNFVPKAPDPQLAQNALIAQLIPTVTAAVVAAMQGGGAPASIPAPAPVDPALWDEFMAFQAFKRAQAGEPAGDDIPPALRKALGDAVDVEKAEWIAKAEEIGLKVDRRLSADKIRSHVMAELERRVAGAEAPSDLREGDLLPGAMGDPLGR